MSHFSHWLKAARLRTLPLAMGGILLGSFFAAYEFSFSLSIFILASVTAVLLQILSNLANDYGDFQKGTDQAANRADRALASGKITISAMKKAIWIVGISTLLFGLTLLFIAFKKVDSDFIIWFMIGILAIIAALKYTIGNNAYGYKGFGDLFVLLFFGPVSVGGTYYLMANQLPNNIWVPAMGFGLLCVSVLNINNLRDIESDKKANKKTLVVLLGYKTGIFYQYLLLASSIFLFILFAKLTKSEYDHYIPILIGTLYYLITNKLAKRPVDKGLYNLALKQVSIINLLFVILLGIFWLS